MKIYTKIIGTGSCIPSRVITNDYFLNYEFYDPSTKAKFTRSNEEIITKFQEITNIKERRWLTDDQVTSDLATIAARKAIEDAKIDPETIDFIISSHNFGDVAHGRTNVDTLPGLGNRIKQKLGIENPSCVCWDQISGCPGWTQAMISADAYLKSKTYRRGLVIGSDALSRVSDPHDRDTMIFADGAGAVVVEGIASEEPIGLIAHSSRSDVNPYSDLLVFGPSLNPDYPKDDQFIKMAGHRLYVYALKHAPALVKDSIDKAGLELHDIKKVLIHQANEKMDEAILKGLFNMYGEKHVPFSEIMPMTIEKLGNSSTATVPTLLDVIVHGKMDDHVIREGDHIVLCSIGAGMNINSIIYKW
ncbi:MAG: 3-oxoacyl-ACP synthase III family protein [Mangrovibacterium sp.]